MTEPIPEYITDNMRAHSDDNSFIRMDKRANITPDDLAALKRMVKRVPQWIAANEQLPPAGCPVLVYGHGMTSICTQTEQGDWFENEFHVLDDDEWPSHWMPLPEPPAIEVEP